MLNYIIIYIIFYSLSINIANYIKNVSIIIYVNNMWNTKKNKLYGNIPNVYSNMENKINQTCIIEMFISNGPNILKHL